jgi:neutral ceramidase
VARVEDRRVIQRLHGGRALLVLMAWVLLVGLISTVPVTSRAKTSEGQLLVGVGRADITPPTGYYAMGWVRSDALLRGQHTRLYARVIVLQRGPRKLALIAEDLNGIPGGMLKAAVDLVRDRGYSEKNVLDSASHTHAAPSGFYNFGTYNTVFMTAQTPTQQNVAGTIDPQLYTFMVRRLALAIRRADDNRGPGLLAWGSTKLLGLTQNRSLEAHLANFGIHVPPGAGRVSMDPLGYADTIDPNVTVLRVDKLIGGRDVPVGMWSTFANHGTVNKFEFNVYNADHHGSATRVVEQAIRSAGDVPARQDVVNAYGNTDEGDQTAGLVRSGPAAADWVGRVEARAMLAAWRAAGSHLTNRPALDWRWTRACFCGESVPGGRVDSRAVIGLPLFTGSEEGRGPLYDLTQTSFEGDRLPIANPADPAQGRKLPAFVQMSSSIPKAVPLMAARIGDALIVSVPGEMTVAMGSRIRAAALRIARPSGVRLAVISGLANEYLQYFTTPEEYEMQHYEGGSTLYGKYSSNFLEQLLLGLVRRLGTGQPVPAPYPFDPRNGVSADASPFPTGTSAASISAQPSRSARFSRASFSWTGAPRGYDRRLDGAFVTVRRFGSKGWTPVTDDLGLQVMWRVDDSGKYTAWWQVPLDAPAGRYDFLVTANHYRLTSRAFEVVKASSLVVTEGSDRAGNVTFTLHYRKPVVNEDLIWWPALVDGATVHVSVDGRPVTVIRTHGSTFAIPGSSDARRVVLTPGGAADRYGNTNASGAVID